MITIDEPLDRFSVARTGFFRTTGPIARRDSLGGVLYDYYRRVA